MVSFSWYCLVSNGGARLPTVIVVSLFFVVTLPALVTARKLAEGSWLYLLVPCSGRAPGKLHSRGPTCSAMGGEIKSCT